MPKQDAVIGDGRAYPILKYRDTVLSPHAADGLRLRSIAEHLGQGLPITVALEPGDATRYDLILCPLFRPRLTSILVARTQPNGAFRVATTVPNPTEAGEFYFNETADEIAINDGWEREFFRWWLRCLWAEVEAVR